MCFLKDDCIRSSLIQCESFLNRKIDVDPKNRVLMSFPCIVQVFFFLHDVVFLSQSRQDPYGFCEGSGDVVGVLTSLVGGVAQAFHDDRVVELRVQLGVEEVKGKTGRNT